MKNTLRFILLLALSVPMTLAAQIPELVTVKDGHIGPVKTGCFSPDERQALSGGNDRRVILWDLAVNKYVRHFETPEIPFELAFTRNGRGAVVLMYDRLQHWELVHGALVLDISLPDYDHHLLRADTLWLEKDERPIAGWIILEDGLKALAPEDLYRLKSTKFSAENYPGLARRMAEFSFDENPSLKYIPERDLAIIYGGKTTGYWMVTPGAPMNRRGSGFIQVWDLQADRALDTMIRVTEEIRHVAVNARGTQCLALSEDKKVYHFDVLGSRILYTFEKERSREIRYCFAGDFSRLAMIDYFGTLKTWPLDRRAGISDHSENLAPLGRYEAFRAETATFSPDNAFLLAGSRRGDIVRIPLDDHRAPQRFQSDPHLNVIQDIRFAPDGRSVYIASTAESRVMMQYVEELPKQEFQGYIKDGQGNTIGISTVHGPKFGTIVQERNTITWRPNHHTVSRWDPVAGTLQRMFQPYEATSWIKKQRLALSSDGLFACSRIEGRWQGWDTDSGTLFSRPPDGQPFDAFYTRDDVDYALTLEENGRIWLWQPGKQATGDRLSADGKIIAIGCDTQGGHCHFLDHEGGLTPWSVHSRGSGTRVQLDRIPDEPEIQATPYPDLALIRGEGSAMLVHTRTGETPIRLQRDPNDVCEGDLYYDGHRASDVGTFAFLPDGIHALSATYDGNITLWKFRTGEVVAHISFPQGTDWVVSTPQGLFDASEGAMRQMYFRIGTEVIELEQLKERYFEPGLLQKILGFTPGGVRSVQDLGDLALYPLVTRIALDKDRLQVTLKPRDGGIGRVALLLNRNIELEPNINPNFSAGFEVDLTPYREYFSTSGENTLSFRAYNRDGWLKSPPQGIPDGGEGAKGGTGGGSRSLQADKNAHLEEVHLYALVVGTSRYRGDALNLKYPDKDASAFAEALRITAEPLFRGNVSITTLTTDGPTWPRKPEIAKALAEIAAVATPNDVLLVYLSGHGITYPPNSEQGQFHYLTTDILSDKLDDPIIRTTQAIGQDTLQEWIRQVRALKRILILDACNSGKVVDNLSIGEKSLNSDQRRALERMYDRSGMFVLAGSAGDKLSFEASQFGHGLLTYSLLNNIPLVAASNNTYVDVGKLFSQTLEEVPRLARDIGKHQQPELIGNSSFDIGILTAQMPYQVPQTVPVYIRPSFLNLAGNRDNIRLSGALSRYLEEMTREPQAQMAFWDIDDFQGKYYYIGGTYTLNADQIECKVSVYERNTLVVEFSVQGSTARVEDLAEDIAQAAFLHIDRKR